MKCAVCGGEVAKLSMENSDGVDFGKGAKEIQMELKDAYTIVMLVIVIFGKHQTELLLILQRFYP